MALTDTILARAMRIGNTPEEMAEVARLRVVAETSVTRHLNGADCPEEIQDESSVRLAAYLYDQPNNGRGVGFANAMRNSGAAALLLPWRIHRAGNVAKAF